MSKNILFAILSVVAIFHQQYIHSSDKKSAALQAERDANLRAQIIAAKHEYETLRKRIIQNKNSFFSAETRVHSAFAAATPALICHACKEPKLEEELFKCARCQTAIYCGRVCQRTAWNNGHKDACKAAVVPTTAKEAKK